MAPFEALYGGLCRSSVCWTEVGEVSMIRPNMMRETTEKIKTIRQRLLTVSPRRGLKRFGRRRKLSPCYIEPFDIIAKIGEVAYRLALPPQLSGVHDVFHVSMLWKYEPDPSHVLEWRDLELEADVSYVERSVHILNTLEHVLRRRSIPMVKVLQTHHGSDETTWEKEDEV
ncbi:uncharacterized protein LOC130759853 [Actinidia eriantha]|uniref:uncharacterized protein LOC130759853 n=1 Tax=Actinidia eriantha TaxID=165200 RepID=UPI002587211A|nr:uncharacterized protein LOC130759853 [Actinidia eriantha]